MTRAAGILLCIAATWTLGALAYYRPRKRCRCGRPEEDDGLGYAVCHPAEDDPEEEDPEPLSERPRALWARGIGRES